MAPLAWFGVGFLCGCVVTLVLQIGGSLVRLSMALHERDAALAQIAEYERLARKRMRESDG